MQETVKRLQSDPQYREKIASVNVGGTAGMEGTGFTPKTADLDFQFRGDANAAKKAQETALEVLKERGYVTETKNGTRHLLRETS